MSQGSRKGGRPKAEGRSGQHISSIAHLFFDNQEEQGQAEANQDDCRVLVVGTGRDTCAPYTAAGLGHHFLDQSVKLTERGSGDVGLSIRQVFLGEPSPVCFSGLSHLDSKTYRPLVADESSVWAGSRSGGKPVYRLFPGTVPSEDFSGGMNDGCFHIRHFDLPLEPELQALESQALRGHTSGLLADGSGGVVWCVNVHSCASLSLVGRLGRLLRIVQPERFFVLVFLGSQKGTSRERSRLDFPGNDVLLERSRRLIEYIAGGVPFDFRMVGTTAEEKVLSLSTLARQLSPF